MRNKIILVTVLSVIFSWSSLASAKSFDMGVKLGASVPTGGFADASDEGLAFGVFGSYLINTRTALQLSFLKHDHDLEVAEPSDILASLGEETLDDFFSMSGADIMMKEVTFSGRYAFSEGKIAPYVIGGGGIYVWDITVDGNESGVRVSESSGTDVDGPNSETTVTNQIGKEISRSNSFVDFGLNAGLGVTFMLTGEISLGVEAMYSYVFGDFDEGFVNFTGVMSYGF